jgi:hypothetical protein
VDFRGAERMGKRQDQDKYTTGINTRDNTTNSFLSKINTMHVWNEKQDHPYVKSTLI